MFSRLISVSWEEVSVRCDPRTRCRSCHGLLVAYYLVIVFSSHAIPLPYLGCLIPFIRCNTSKDCFNKKHMYEHRATQFVCFGLHVIHGALAWGALVERFPEVNHHHGPCKEGCVCVTVLPPGHVGQWIRTVELDNPALHPYLWAVLFACLAWIGQNFVA